MLWSAQEPTIARGVDDAPRVVTGTVVTSDGKPVAGADVWLVGETYPEPRAIVIDRARSSAAGRFRLVWDETRLKGRFVGSHAVWAHRKGFQTARAMFLESWTESGVDPDFPIRLTLAPPSETKFRVLDPEGNAVAGAKVAVVHLRDDQTSVPVELGDRLASLTDQAGAVVLRGTVGESIQTVQATTPDYGAQRFNRENGFAAENELKLVAVAPASGRVSADDPAAVRGVRLHVEGMKKVEDGAWISSLADVTSDGQGRFSIPKLLAGYVYAEASIADTAIYKQVMSANNEFEGARKIEISVPLERWGHVRGMIREKGTDKPVAGVGIRFSNSKSPGPIPLVGKTDASGRFDAIAPRGKEVFCFPDTPKAFLKLGRGIEMPEITGDGQELPPIELERGVSLRGIVVDEEGKPVARATVLGKWNRIGPAVKAPNGADMAIGFDFSVRAKTDVRGEFLLEGIHAGANVTLQAEAGDAQTGAPQPAAAGMADPVKLVISGANLVSLEGRVVDGSGKPASYVLVQIRSRTLRRDASPDPSPIRIRDGGPIRADENGHFETPRQVKRGFEYRAEVKPDDPSLMSDCFPWLALRPDTAPALGNVVLRRLRTVEGRILDSRGEPVAGARVRQSGDGPVWTEAETDANGHYRLPGVVAEPAFVFVAKRGFRLTGRSIGADSAPAEVTLAPSDEPARPMTTLPPPLSPAQERKLLHLIFDPYTEQVIKEKHSRDRFEVLRILTEIEPAKARELLERADFSVDVPVPDFRRGEVAVAIFKKRPDEGLDMIAAIRDPNARSFAYEQASAAVADSDRDRKLGILTESLVAGRAVADPADRTLRLADLGRRFLDLGQVDQAAKLLREGQEIARRLPSTGWPAFARGNLAEELALIDLSAATELLKGTEKEREHESHLGHIAHRLAGKNPAEAERVLRVSKDHWPYFRDMYTQRVCYRMVTVDPERALNLARTLMTNYRYKARALGAMALALASFKGDRDQARRLLDEAFGLLEQVAGSKEDQWDGLSMACTAAAGLLPIVEMVDPRMVREYLWRTLAIRPPLRGGDGRDAIALIAGARVAAMVARYDRDLARQILDSLAETEGSKLASGGRDASYVVSSLLRAAAFIAPLRAAALITRLPDSTTEPGPSLRNQARLECARVLATPPGEERWRMLERSFLLVWPIDSEED
jgi:protocatechuate 3,4-dioxygenase beta subunit